MTKKAKSGKSDKKKGKVGGSPTLRTSEVAHTTRATGTEPVISPRRRQRAGEAMAPVAGPGAPAAPDPAPSVAPSTAPTTALITNLTSIANRSTLAVDARVRASGLRTPELSVYALLADGQRLTPGEISEATGLAPTTVSSLLRRAEQRGDIARVPHPRDARSYHLLLTDSGRFRYTEALVYLDPLVRSLRQPGVPTGTQVVSALALLRRWVDAMDAGRVSV